ncbi:hypothetical protein ACFPRL_32855 [Pseudoclavibacter helvolus]
MGLELLGALVDDLDAVFFCPACPRLLEELCLGVDDRAVDGDLVIAGAALVCLHTGTTGTGCQPETGDCECGNRCCGAPLRGCCH